MNLPTNSGAAAQSPLAPPTTSDADTPPLSASSVALVIGGAALLGALSAVNAESTLYSVARASMLVPAIVLGLAVVMVPALYILSAQLGFGPRAEVFVGATARGLRSAGLVMLGLALPASFLIFTADAAAVGQLVASAVAGVSMLIGLGVFYVHLFNTGDWTRGSGVFGVWAVVALVCGARLFFSMMAGA